MPGHPCSWVPGPKEECDTTTTKTCTDLGYYSGGAVTCSQCKLDASACDACPPSSQCATTTALDVYYVVASGTRVAVGSSEVVAVFDGISEVTRVSIAEIQDIAAAPGGWYIVANNPPNLYFLDTNGQLGAETALERCG